jgi:hypothetical protein
LRTEHDYTFKFQILDHYPSILDETGTKEIRVTAIIRRQTHLVFEGPIRVKFNPFGIFPSIADVAEAVSNPPLRRLLMVELKRYVKPHRKFL